VELLITVTILAVLAAGLVPLGQLSVQRSREGDLRRALREIRTAIDEYKRASDDGRIARKADETGYPPSLEALLQGALDAKSPQPKRIRFLRRMPRDPFSTDPSLPATATWGLRSYESPHDRPFAGKDVYDVYSSSEGRGLNGIAYREW
jgi:general secretion pathway protein G